MIYLVITVSTCLLLILVLHNQKMIVFDVFLKFIKLHVLALFALFFIYLIAWLFSIAMDSLGVILDTFGWYYSQVNDQFSYGGQSFFWKVISVLELPMTTLNKFFKIDILDLHIFVEFKNSPKFLYINLDKILKANMSLSYPSSLFGIISGLLIIMVYIQYPNIISMV
jgi:hypothetical protein